MFFLGIVTRANIMKGIIIPQYILCKQNNKSTSRTELHVVNIESDRVKKFQKLLVREMTGHDDLLNYLKVYRTRDHEHGNPNHDYEETKKYNVKGALFWFTCNKYGEQNGPAYYIRPVPYLEPGDDYFDVRDNAKKYLEEARAHVPDIKELFVNEPMNMPYGTYVFVPLPDSRWSRRNPLFTRKKRRRKRASVSNNS